MSINIHDSFNDWIDLNSGKTESEFRSETSQHGQLQAIKDDFIDGLVDVDVLLDARQEIRGDVDEYIESIQDAWKYHVDSGIVYKLNRAGLFIPSGMLI